VSTASLPILHISLASTVRAKAADKTWGNQSMLTLYFDVLFGEFARVLKPSGRVFMFTDWRTYPVAYVSAFKRLRVSNMIAWDYGWIKAGAQFRFTHELILHATMPNTPSPKNRSTSDVWRMKPVNFTTERYHSAEKPVEIIRKMLDETTEQGDLVLAPFMGSGTAAVACKQSGRKFIGFEINPHYVAVAETRLRELDKQGRLRKFVNQSPSPTDLGKYQ
jgi:site-specific DNA-methyltransferase (adenine-specific)